MRSESTLYATAATAAAVSLFFTAMVAPSVDALGWLAIGLLCGAAITRIATRPRPDTANASPADDLLPNTAHELRTPLTVVMASIGMIREGRAAADDDHDALLTQASAACQLLAFLINDLVDDAAIRAGSLRLDAHDWPVAELLSETTDLLEPVAQARGMQLRIGTPPAHAVLRVDAHRLQQVLFNLIGNALKYAPDGSTVELRTSLVGAAIRFEVVDQGQGVPLAQRDALFARFQRIPAERTRHVPGSGIGLHLCRQLVEQMGGRIGYRESEDAAGAVFWFELGGVRTVPPVAVAAGGA